MICASVRLAESYAVTDRPPKITFARMRAAGVRGLLVYCTDYRCTRSLAISGDAWGDDVRLSDIEPRFVWPAASGRRRSARSQLESTRSDRRYGLSIRIRDSLLGRLAWPHNATQPIELPPTVARSFVRNMRAYFAAGRSPKGRCCSASLAAQPTHGQDGQGVWGQRAIPRDEGPADVYSRRKFMRQPPLQDATILEALDETWRSPAQIRRRIETRCGVFEVAAALDRFADSGQIERKSLGAPVPKRSSKKIQTSACIEKLHDVVSSRPASVGSCGAQQLCN
jgi:hypothetical protein